MIKITEDIFLDKEQISSVEREIINKWVPSVSFSDCCEYKESFNGSRVTLKNGRKVFIDKLLPHEIIEKLAQENDEGLVR